MRLSLRGLLQLARPRRPRPIGVAVLLTVALLAESLPAAIVHVRESVSVGGDIVATAERAVQTGDRYVTGAAQRVEGAIFAQWTISVAQPVEARDAWGRSLESAAFTVYEDTEVTAVYLDENEDADCDGVPDALEIYWYGDLVQDADSDTDSDGVGFLDELQQGRSPLFADEADYGRILIYSNDDVLYNPNGYAPYVIRSEPENALFPTRRVYASPGDGVTTEAFSPKDSGFAYWTVNGERAADAWGVSSATVSFVASDKVYTECVAHVLEDELSRNAYYWYGRPCAADSDVDGDGYTFAEELMQGLSPVFADEMDSGRVMDFSSSEVLYNPFGYVPYTIRSEPEGLLFATINDWRLPGTEVTTPQFDPATSAFAYWKRNGARQQDDWGVAVDAITFTAQSNGLALVAVAEQDPWKRLSLYWYGDDGHGAESDADGDGYTFREELEKGLSPVFADETDGGRVLAFDSDGVEVSLQDYEQVQGVIVDGEYVDLFASGHAGKVGETFFDGAAIQPVVADVNGDGLWDIVVVKVESGEKKIYVNCGTRGSPKFAVRSDETLLPRGVDLAMNSTEKLAGLTMDVVAVGALSATYAGEDLLVSDEAGRIWFYRYGGMKYELQNKVWGGTYAGFANGLRIAAVDWEDDGDWDCLCGTADGKLMFLRDPKVGRPVNLRALVGVDNVLLEWDPNELSRARGYRVYRSSVDANARAQGDLVAEPTVPRHRDWPSVIQDYIYQVTALSRFYTAGNSTPTISESVPTDAVRVELGKVAFRWGDAKGLEGEEIAVALGIENSLSISGKGLELEVGYDSAALTPVRVEASGLTENVTFAQHVADGMWCVSAEDGEIAAGGGTFLTFVFKAGAVDGGDAVRTGVALTKVSLKSARGAFVPAVLPTAHAAVDVLPVVEPVPIPVSITLTESVQVTAGDSFVVAVSAKGEGVDLATLAYEYVYDRSLFDCVGGMFTAKNVPTTATTTIGITNVSVRAADGSATKITSVGTCVVVVLSNAGGDIDDGGEEEEDDGADFEHDEDGELVDWGEEPGEGDAAYRWGFRNAYIDLGTASGKIGDEVEVGVRLRRGALPLLVDSTVDVKRWAFTVKYDDRWLTPVGVNAKIGEYQWSATNGVMTVVGKSGTVSLGRLFLTADWQYPLSLKFKLNIQYAETLAGLSFGAVQARSVEGKRIYTPWRTAGSVVISYTRPKDDPTVVAPYGRGDVNGDGRLTKEDTQLMARLMQGNEKWNADQLRAGDYNDDGKLDNNDYQLMRADFRAKGVL